MKKKLKRFKCGHYNITDSLVGEEVCQICAAKKYYPIDLAYAHRHNPKINGKPVLFLPSYNPVDEKVLISRKKYAKICVSSK